MNIAVVILNWNGRALLEKYLPSVIANSGQAKIYVADNASTDDSVQFVREKFPEIELILNQENGGFAKGYNDALRHLEEDIYCLLNSDVEVTPNWLDPIIKEFENQPETAIIQPKILDHNNKGYFEYAGAAGGYIDRYAYPYCRGRLFGTIEMDKQQYSDRQSIMWASGACMFIRKEVYRALNGFDESFFAHMEEIDLCWRAFNNNYSTTYIGDSVVYHEGGATLKNTNPKKTFLNFRNSLFTLTKNASGNLFLLILSRLLLDGIAAIKFILELRWSHTFAILNAHISFYQQVNRLLVQRRALPKRKDYYTVRSVIWAYFVLRRKTFSSL